MSMYCNNIFFNIYSISNRVIIIFRPIIERINKCGASQRCSNPITIYTVYDSCIIPKNQKRSASFKLQLTYF